jgi:alpha-galactosidase/6-phospho-beta-glucosidase family protein
VNHYTWLLKAYVQGKDVTSDLVRALAESDVREAPWGWQRVIEITRAYQCVPIPGSHMVDYLFRSDTVAHQKEVRHWGLGDPATAGASAWAHYEELARAEDPQFDLSIPGMHQYVGSRAISPCPSSRPHRGSAEVCSATSANPLPRGEIVESPAVVGAFGAQPIAVGDLPETVLPMTETRQASRRSTRRSPGTGAAAALMTDRWWTPSPKSWPMMEEMLRRRSGCCSSRSERAPPGGRRMESGDVHTKE